MLLFTDGSNYDDIFSLILLLKSGIKIDAIIITANGWSHSSASLVVITYIVKWFGRDIPIIVGSLYALKDYEQNYEVKGYTQGKMFGRTIPEKNLFDVSMLYSYISWLPPYKIEQKVYKDDYMDQLMKIVDNMSEIDILSLGALTDVALLIRRLERDDRLYKIKRVLHLGGGIIGKGGGSVHTIDRSCRAAYNNYLDPDAAAECLKKLGKRMHWLTTDASASVQFTLKELKTIVETSTTPENIFLYLLSKVRITEGTDVPLDQLEDNLVIWDAITVIIFLYPEYGKHVHERLCSNKRSSVHVYEDCRETEVVYRYDNRLAEMHYNDCGYCTTVIYEINEVETRKKFYELFGSQKITAICNLRKPMGCYETEEVTQIPEDE